MRSSSTIRTGLVGLLLLLVTGGTLLAVSQPAVATDADGVAADGSYQQTKTLQRVFKDADGAEKVVDERRVTVHVDQTRELRGRERVTVSWSGARPSAGRSTNPFGERGMTQEYPVVIMQCRGIDDPSLPKDRQLRRETCWTTTRQQRSQSVAEQNATWLHDLYASEEEREQRYGISPWPDAETCLDLSDEASRLTPFEAANGTVYPACSTETMPPEAAVDASFPAAEQAAFTAQDGTGRVKFEIRSSVENASLGCGPEVPCSLVVIPIMGVSCDGEDQRCRATGLFQPGESNFDGRGVDAAVAPDLWWSESNWRHRFSVPLTFGMPPDTCDVLDSRAPTGFYGSELLAQTSLQWSPAYCLAADRFKFQHNRMPDEASFALMQRGEAAAALVSTEHERTGTDPVVYAPTAVTGFGIGYIIDNPGNAGEYTDLRLNARLLAKLLTQSYVGSSLGRGHPGIEGNPTSLNRDPEFKAINPGLDEISREAAATLLSLSEASDVLGALTAYIAADPDALAFVNGQPDEWGMVVNPTYLGTELPTTNWELKDQYIPVTSQECRNENPAPYFSQLAAPVPSLRRIAEAVLDAWPNVQTKCERPNLDEPWKVGRIDRQGVGTRFMLGVVSLGDATRFGLHTAALETTKGTYVAPSDAAMSAAVQLGARPEKAKKKSKKVRKKAKDAKGKKSKAKADRSSVSKPSGKQDDESGTETPRSMLPLVLDQESLRGSARAYPGTMVVYTAARASGMVPDEAARVAGFIRIAATEGQRRGRGNGELAEGYLPIVDSGATKRLYEQARRVAREVERQKGFGGTPKAAKEKKEPKEKPVEPSSGKPAADQELPAIEAVPEAPAELPPDAAPASAPADTPVAVATPTSAVESLLARGILPLLLLIGLLGGVVASGARILLRVRGSR